MATCTDCKGTFWRLDMIDGRCIKCSKAASEAQAAAAVAAQQRRDMLAARSDRIIMTTEGAPIGMAINSRIGVVSAECAFGMNLFKDAFTEIRDLVGGRSRSLEVTLADAREAALKELRIRGAEMGADAVIAIDLDISEFGRSAVLVMATGTAVTLTGG